MRDFINQDIADLTQAYADLRKRDIEMEKILLETGVTVADMLARIADLERLVIARAVDAHTDACAPRPQKRIS